jgi:thioester reductase-like protein
MVVLTSNYNSMCVYTDYRGPLPVPEAPLPDLSSAVGLGYGESKLVAERMLEVARERSGLDASVVRVGQLCGSSGLGGAGGNVGAWNTKEWFPALVQASDVLGLLPDLDSNQNKIDIDWAPIDVAAQTIVDIRASSSNEYIHIVHPCPTSCRVLLDAVSHGLGGIPVVPYMQWYMALEALSQEEKIVKRQVATNGSYYDGGAETVGDGKKPIQAIQLLRFFRGSFLQQLPQSESTITPTVPETGHVVAPTFMLGQQLDMYETLKASPSGLLRNLKNLEEADVLAWIGYWREVGFLR